MADDTQRMCSTAQAETFPLQQVLSVHVVRASAAIDASALTPLPDLYTTKALLMADR